MGDPVNGGRMVPAEGRKMEMTVAVRMKTSCPPEYNSRKKEITVKFDGNHLAEIRDVRLDWEFMDGGNRPLRVSGAGRHTMRKDRDGYCISNVSPPAGEPGNGRTISGCTLKKITVKTSVCDDIVCEVK